MSVGVHSLSLNVSLIGVSLSSRVGAVLGEYISAAFWGALADSYGPRPLSFAAAICFGAGYSLMAHGDARAIRQKQHDGLDMRIADSLAGGLGISQRDWVPTGYGALTFYFVLVGVGVAASYFSAVTSATRLFPRHPSLAIALPLTLFSLSSLFLTTIGSSVFVDKETGDLDASAFLTFLAILLSVTNFVSTFGMRPPPVVVLDEDEENNEEVDTLQPGRRKKVTPAPRQHGDELNETTPLLSRENGEVEAGNSSYSGSAAGAASNISLVPKSDSLKDFLRTPSVWVLAVLMFTAVGGAEMVMSSVGNMVVSLIGGNVLPGGGGKNLPGPGLNNDALKWRSLQVQLLATANTLSRLVSGLLADFLSPARPLVTILPSSSTENSKWRSMLRTVWSRINNIRVSRMTILLCATSLLTATFAYAATMLNSLLGLVFVSIAVGCGYGFSFTLVPSIVASAFGLRTFGRSWGLLSYACAAGSLSFSLLYAVARTRRNLQPRTASACKGDTAFRRALRLRL